MKKLLLAFLLLLFCAEVYAQWEILNEGFRGQINTIDFVNEDVGWLAGNNGMLSKTSDGGINWNDILIDESWSISHLDFINESVGWGVVSRCDSVRCYAVIIKSLDGGITWQVQKQINDIGLNRIFVIDENYAFAIGDRIYKTSDGGVNWTNITPIANVYFNNIWFKDSLSGIVTGDPIDGNRLILKTTDGGLIWDKKNASVSFNGLHFINSTTGYFFNQEDTVTCFYKTDDMLSSWTILSKIEGYMSSFQVVDAYLVYAVGSFKEGTVIKSMDGGITWQNFSSGNYSGKVKDAGDIKMVYGKAPPSTGIYLGGIYIFGKNLGFITGFLWSLPLLYRSTDLDNWELQRFSYPLNDITFFNRDRGLSVGGGGYCRSHSTKRGGIFSTDNGGINWEVDSISLWNFQSCFALDINIAFLSGSSCRYPAMFKSNNSGRTWNEYYVSDTLGNSFQGSDICFADINNGFAVGYYSEAESSGAGIMQTQDQGVTWELIFKYPNVNDYWYSLSSICFTGTTGWAVGKGVWYTNDQIQFSGLILKYNPQSGGWVKKDSVTDLPLRKVFFTDENHGWISGGHIDQLAPIFKPVYLKTTNGGETWQEKELSYLINDLWFIDNLHGWAVGSDSLWKGVVLESIDGGENWTVEMDNLIAPLNSIYIKDNCAWTVGDNGLILRNTTDIVSLEEEKTNHPSEFVLEQNYPNPFNPGTKIKYEIPGHTWNDNSRVTLKVYDILGREIATLIDEHKPAGKYEIEFNAEKLTSGVYFYQLKAGEFIQTKQMLLLR